VRYAYITDVTARVARDDTCAVPNWR